MALPAHSSARAPSVRLPALRHFGPNWYALVMGTSIVSSSGAALPVHVPGLYTVCTAVWALAVLALIAVAVARAGHWLYHSDQARAHLLDPAVAPFYGCLAMGLMAVGNSTLTVGRSVIGQGAALAADSVLWTAGTVIGLACTVVVPYLMVVRHRIGPDGASAVWLLAVVPPMVSAALGAPLIPHLPAGAWRETLLLGCYGMFGMSLLATLLILPLLVGRLVVYGPLPLALTPSLFLVLGPVGQATTAVNQLADAAQGTVRPEYAAGFGAFALVFGVPMLGFAMLWLVLAGALVVRALRHGMTFSMGWWAFTFPVGTCVTGAEGLARHTGLAAYTWLAVALYVLLAVAWLVAAVCSVRGLFSGALLAAPLAAQPETGRTT
ncbi:TDT family transporter [Streptomyces sp. NBC_01387]|uniref:TDT family transporter n=1 Tax=Streptomyces sp. NBC_01387 TaxID=2903849 RepID=UPI0032547B45